MISTPQTEQVPIERDANDVIRVGGTRVILDSVIYSFRQGATPETIVQQFPVLSLADVYLVLGYYLNHRAEVDAYLREQEAIADEIQREVERIFPADGIRERLLARMEARKKES